MNKFLKIAAVLATVSFVSGSAFAATNEPKSANMAEATSDAMLTAKVKAALAADSRTTATDVKVITAGKVAHLSGEIKSTEKTSDYEVVAKVDGVDSVDVSKLTVAPAA